MVKPPFRTKTLSTKVSEEQFTQLEAAANKSGLTLSEWCREAMLAGVNGQKEKSVADLCAADGTGQALMAELVALGAADTRGDARVDRPGRLGEGPEGARAFGTGIIFETTVNPCGFGLRVG